MQIGNRDFDVKHQTYIMGILNITPDSFSDGGKYHKVDDALYHAQQMIQDGAHIIDVGGESTRPGYTPITEEEEIERTVPVIEALKKNFDIPVSIDTYKSGVALANIKAGADMVNDIWGLKADVKMAEVIREAGVACCLMHNRNDMNYMDFMEDMKQDLRESVAIAKEAGIDPEKIMLDPGIGFAKSYENNIEAIRRVGELKELGYPILLAASKKSVIGLTLEAEAKDRVIGTAVTTAYGVMQGCSFVRVHDVKENLQAIRMIKALI